MKLLFLVMIVLVLAAVVTRFAPSKGARRGTFGQRRLATANEQKMFWRLAEAFPMPEHMVFVQVSFGALLTAKQGASRYSFSQKRADFVVADKGFNVLAVIELDDKSHQGNEAKDRERDEMLKAAGYKVLRFGSIPEKSELLNAFEPLEEILPITQPMSAK